MKPKAQRIAIAEACGFTNIHQVVQSDMHNALWVGVAPGSLSDFTFPLPDYTSDLNAMHAALLTLSEKQQVPFLQTLACMVATEAECDLDPMLVDWRFVTATPAQLAEAFLRTIGKWVDEPALYCSICSSEEHKDGDCLR